MMASGENDHVVISSDQIYRHEAHHTELQVLLYQQWSSASNCDLDICCKGSILPVHGCVIACFSPRVCTHLSDAAGNVYGRSVRVRYDYNVVKDLVTFMYTGSLKISQHSAQQMLKCAQWFGVTTAVNFVQEFLQSRNVGATSASQTSEVIKKGKLCSAKEVANTSFNQDQPDISSDTERNSVLDACMDDSVVEIKPTVKQEFIEINIAHEKLSTIEEDESQEMALPVTFLRMEGDCGISGHNEMIETSERACQTHIASKVCRPKTTMKGAHCSTSTAAFNVVMAVHKQVFMTGNEPESTTDVQVASNDTKKVPGSSEHKCKWCESLFPSRKELFTHVEFTHHPFACVECPERFSRKENLTRHIQRYHQAPVEWKCPHCEDRFSLKHAFQKHCKNIHDETKPYWCDFPGCSFKFSSVQSLQSHKDSKHVGLRVVCENCGKKFTKDVLPIHRKTCVDTGQYLCQECGKVFNLGASLAQHIRAIHRKEAKYACTKCSKKFSHPRNLYRHNLIHDNVCPYVCERCGQKFRHSNSLKYHVEKKHSQ